MRFLKSALPLIGAAAILAGCMGGLTSGTTPSTSGGTSAMSTLSHGGMAPALKFASITGDTTCPSQYYACAALSQSTPYYAGWCVSSTGNCTSGLVGTWDWTTAVTNAKTGKPTDKKNKNPTITWSPDPGNPSTMEAIAKNAKPAKKFKVKWAAALSTCDSTGYCFSNFVTYGFGT